MPTNSEEIFIQKVNVEVTTTSTESAKSVEGNIHAFLEKQVFPQIEKWLSEKLQQSPPGYLQLSNLSLTLDLDPRQLQSVDLDTGLSQVLITQLIDQMQPLVLEASPPRMHSEPSVISRESLTMWGDPTALNDFNNVNLKDNKSVSYRFLSEEQKGFYAWLHFLQFGVRPWFAVDLPPHQMTYASQGRNWVLLKEFKELTTSVLVLPSAMNRLLLQHKDVEISHLIVHLIDLAVPLAKFNQLNERFDHAIQRINRALFLYGWLAVKLGKESEEQWKRWAPSLKGLCSLLGVPAASSNEETRFWRQVMAIYGREPQIEGFLALVRPEQSQSSQNLLMRKPNNEAFLEWTATSEIPSIKEDSAARYLADSLPMCHAGLILIHPFLVAFLQDVGVVGQEKRLLRPNLGLHLLHYVATGKLQPYEFELGFEKFLVGWDGTVPYDKQTELSTSDLEKCDRLLESLITNWRKLKNTGKETVRTGFLQREGKLIEEDYRYRLIVERMAQDVLLKSLPFTIGVVKLPWQKKLVFVEW